MTTTRPRLEKALALNVMELGTIRGQDTYRVTGGERPGGYRVVIRDGIPVCPCRDYTYRGPMLEVGEEGTLCKHAVAVLIYLAGPAGRMAVVAELAR